MNTKTYRYSELADALIASGTVVDMATDYQSWKSLALMIADLGENARDIFDKLSATASNYDSKQTYSIFTWALNNYDPTRSTIGSFLHLCKEAGIDLSDYVTDSPSALRPVSWTDKKSFGKRVYKKPYTPRPLPKDSTLYSIPTKWINATLPVSYESSPLARYLAQKFGWEKVNAAFKLYYVGVTRKVIPLGGMRILPVGSCIFPEVDESGHVRTAQMMGFDDENGRFGHRSKGFDGRNSYLTWMHSVMMTDLLKRTGNQWGWDDNRKRKPYDCLSGLHLLNTKAYPTLSDKTVGIVESMSTALCMTCAMPDLVWLSTNGCSGIRLLADAIKRDAPSLTYRNIVVYPDQGKTDSWRKAISELGLQHVSVSDFMDRQDLPGGDIKDIIMSTTEDIQSVSQEEPDIVQTPKLRMNRLLEKSEALRNLVDTLHLELVED